MTDEYPTSVPSEALIAAGYDAVYSGITGSPSLQRIWHELASGVDFPEEFGTISFVTVEEISRFEIESQLTAGGHLVDLACGAGGPGLLVARGTSARLIGIDLAAAGIDAARARAAAVGLAATSRFETGSFAATGLDDGCADAVMTIDAFQYATDKRAACAEIARILRRGGRFVFTAFEVEPSRVAGLPILGDDPVADYTASLEAAGFEVDSYSETTAWWERVAASYRAVLDAEAVLTEEMGAPAFGALASEMSMTLAVEPYRRRVFGVATRT